MLQMKGMAFQDRLAEDGGEVEQVAGKSIHAARRSTSKSSADSRERAPESSRQRSSRSYTESSNVPQGNSTSTSRNSSSSSRRSGSSSSSSSRTAESSHRRSISTNNAAKDSASSSSRRRHEEEAKQKNMPSVGMEEPTSPLPHGWSVAFSKSGRKYYHNEIDKTNVWEKPTCEATTESNGSAPLGSAHSSSGNGRDSNADRRQHSNNGGDAAGKSTRRVPRDVETGGTDTALAPPRKSRDATMATKRGGAPPPLPDRPLADASTGSSSRKPASRSSDARAASNSNGSSSSISSSSISSSKPRRGERDVSVAQASRAVGQVPDSGAGNESREAARSDGVTQSSSRGAEGATGQTAAAASKDAPPQLDAATFDPALFGMPPGMQLPAGAQEQLMKQFRSMPKQHQQMLLQQQAMAQKQASTHQQGPHVAPGGPGMPGAAAAANAEQPSLYGGNPGGNQPMYPSGLAGTLTKGIGNLITGMATAQKVKPPPKGYVGMTGGGFTTPGSYSKKDLKTKKKKKSSRSSSASDEKGDRDGTTIKLFNGIVKSSFKLVGMGDRCKLKLKKDKNGKLKWKGDVDVSDSECESENKGEDADSECDEVDVEAEVDVEIVAGGEEGEEEEKEEEEKEEDDCYEESVEVGKAEEEEECPELKEAKGEQIAGVSVP